MRWSRVVAVVSFVLAAIGASAQPAAADGGAYMDLDRTHYLPGQTAVATTYVSVPTDKQQLLARGPFFAFLITGRDWPRPGRPIPPDAIPMGAFEVHQERGTSFELTARLSIPDVPGDFYSIGFCNDPCTISGFKEPISGYISIVQTMREAQLLDERQHLFGRVNRLQRQLRKGTKDLEALRAAFDARERDRAYLADEVNRLNHALERVRETGRRASERAVVGWSAATVALALCAVLVLVGLVRRRRAPTPAIPDTAEALVRELEDETKVRW
jgi:hypothetical protein